MTKYDKKFKTLYDTYIIESDVCMGEFLANECVPPNTTFEEAFHLYVDAMKKSEGDKFWVQIEEEVKEL